ncbi:glycosyl hydrolase [Pedobacter antarcticus 4BY]|uniref:Glycosyl hydrolase n=3 Tax=Pedobacter antarcticus TaxID=34086 RepID=A0A081PBK9_9SPHI|nr:glycosyl hydrolase [Pedobacter antarcticus 4BY]SFE41257.1 Glycosyl hydrolases family 2, sugar binding domain [Pedobacter antarcticus]
MNLKMHLLPRIFFVLLLSGVPTTYAQLPLQNLRVNFIKPPDVYKPGVYWYFMDGNMTAASITKDLESMKEAGIGNLIFLEVNVGVPRGNVDFLSETWKSLFVFAEKEARRLGIEITLGIGPGWTGSGGPWVKPEQSMKHLVSSQVSVSGGEGKKIVLPVPLPKKPFFGEGNLTDDFKKDWMHYYEDVAVLAFPEVEKGSPIEDYEEKALFYRAPYSSGEVRALMPSPSALKGNSKSAIQKSKIIDLTGKMQADGTLNWTPASGRWTVMRFVSRNNGAITRPASFPGLGFEADKFDTTAINAHLDVYVGSLLKRIGKTNKSNGGGLKRLHMDSWEMGAQNWTANFRNEFLRRRGYDPIRYYPVYAGSVVGSLEESERFLWDLRQTSQELVLENHAEHVRKYAHRHGLELSIEPYDMNPTSDLDLGSVADVPMAEFWSKGFGFNSTYSVIEATSIGHIMGKSLIPAEAFTAQGGEGWQQHPGSIKNQGDWAFAAGINRFVYHTFQNQFLPDSLKPGATMGPYGVHWDRSQTWWPMAGSYHDYVTRSQYLLQQGRTVADILYLTPEGSPLVFVPPSTAIVGDTIGDRRGYNFDGCSPLQLLKASVKNKQVVFPGGASYRILVLPAYESMTPALLTKIGELVSAGATVVGSPPRRSPSLVNYPACDQQVLTMSNTIWGGSQNPAQETFRSYGKGQLIWGGQVSRNLDDLYPRYETTAKILSALDLIEDFKADGPVRYTHRTDENWDLYFVSNTTDRQVDLTAEFRSVKGSPEFWNAVTGKITQTDQFETIGQKTLVPLQLDAYESIFVLFSADNTWKPALIKKKKSLDPVLTLGGPWEVKFDPVWGGPANQVFPTLTDWSKNENEGIKYYSGTAVYQKEFDLSASDLKAETPVYLDLGKVKNMARIKLNGKDLGVVWTAPWRVDISGLLKKKNKLSIEVVNLWPNRLIGDEHKPFDGVVNDQWPAWLLNNQPRTSGRYTFTSSQPYKADTPLFESGLLGPVTIVREKIREIK